MSELDAAIEKAFEAYRTHRRGVGYFVSPALIHCFRAGVLLGLKLSETQPAEIPGHITDATGPTGQRGARGGQK